MEGRSHVIDAWLSALPPAQLSSEPWLQYWSGICRLAFDPTGARPYRAGPITPPATARKAPHKLLELLALLVASGDCGVSIERAVEAVWPALGGTRRRRV